MYHMFFYVDVKLLIKKLHIVKYIVVMHVMLLLSHHVEEIMISTDIQGVKKMYAHISS